MNYLLSKTKGIELRSLGDHNFHSSDHFVSNPFLCKNELSWIYFFFFKQIQGHCFNNRAGCIEFWQSQLISNSSYFFIDFIIILCKGTSKVLAFEQYMNYEKSCMDFPPLQNSQSLSSSKQTF